MLETRPENSRRILLILSESRDRGSKMKLAPAIEMAQRAGHGVSGDLFGSGHGMDCEAGR